MKLREISAGMLTWMLGGYLLGLVIGFTAFDPDLDVWALLSAVLALVGIAIGGLPYFRARMIPVLTGIIGFYICFLLGVLIFLGKINVGLLDALENRSIAMLMLAGTLMGLVIPWRLDLQNFRWVLFAFVLGGFATPLIILLIVGTEGKQDVALAPLVIISGLTWAGIAWQLGQQTQNKNQSA